MGGKKIDEILAELAASSEWIWVPDDFADCSLPPSPAALQQPLQTE